MNSNYVLPITIVIAGALIAGAVFLAGKSSTANPNQTGQTITAREYTPGKDHILGNPNAEVKVVEYFDLECPHCKEFQTTMNQIIQYYDQTAPGKVAWVARNFPLAQIHSKAPQEHQAAECAAEQGGDQAYFRFVDKVFEVSPTNNGFDLSQLPVIAKDMGLDMDKFNSCLNSGKYASKVQEGYNEAMALGAQGTPYVLVMRGTDSIVLPGAQPYDSMRAAIDAVLGDLGTTPANTGTTTQQ
jgi:protein-disulfide isomerase